jgi:hypothetical protein
MEVENFEKDKVSLVGLISKMKRGFVIVCDADTAKFGMVCTQESIPDVLLMIDQLKFDLMIQNSLSRMKSPEFKKLIKDMKKTVGIEPTDFKRYMG